MKKQTFDNSILCYYGWSNDPTVRQNSSSGGMFYEFAQRAIINGGVAIGAAFDKDGKVFLHCVENEKDLKKLLGSKYLQSRTDDIFYIVKKKLSEGKPVVFCGAPCQCNALYKFLGKHPENLLIIDFICHGVPSEQLWNEYLIYRSNGKHCKDFSFRDKRISWGEYGTRINFEDGTEYFEQHKSDPYMKIFLSNSALRPSCYNCRAKGKNRRFSDITLGDFWGTQCRKTQGISVLIVNSEMGEKWFNEIVDKLCVEKISLAEATKNNPNYFVSCAIPLSRKKVIQKIQKRPKELFDNPDKYLHRSFFKKVVQKMFKVVLRNYLNNTTQKCYLDINSNSVRKSFKALSLCSGCEGCTAVCPTNAISMEFDSEGFRYPKINENKCCHCNRCIEFCVK